jgi:predicted naringenin-chalcone synthase
MNARILSVETKLPDGLRSQDEALLAAGYTDKNNPLHRKAAAVFRSAGVEKRSWFLRGRPFCLPDKDELYERHVAGVRALAPPVAEAAVEAAGLAMRDIGFLVFATESGLTVPAFSMELAHALGIGEDKATCNLLGFGCNALVPAMDLAVTR